MVWAFLIGGLHSGVANAISLPLTGWLTQRYGQVRLFTASVLLFVVASFLCGLAPSLGWLIAFRVLQGAVAGPMIPLSQSLLLSSYPKAKAGSALAIWGITTLVAPVVGPLLAAAYLLLADGLSHGQSVGKKLFGVRAVVISRRAPAGYRESILRNAPFGLVMVFTAVPLLWPVLLIAGVPTVAFETWQVFDDRLGIRIGDFFADTQVVDAKVFTRDAEVAAARHLGIAVPPSPPASVSRRDVAPPDARGAA